MDEQLISKQRPYLIRAMHEWMIDNELTPHIVADASGGGLLIPDEHIKDGKIVLNVSYSATRGLILGNEDLSFEARFAGVAQQLRIPVHLVLGIYARETGQGMIFTDESEANESSANVEPSDEPDRPTLKIVK